MTLLPLAHAGAGATWQSMVVVFGLVLAVTVAAALAGRLTIDHRDDLLVPLAAATMASSFGAIVGETVSDWIGWGLPLAVVSLLAMLLAAFTPLDLALPAPLGMATLALAVVASVLLHQPLSARLHPPADLLPLADDSAVTIVHPEDGAELIPGPIDVEVEVTGGSIGPGGLTEDQLPDDPEVAGSLAVVLARVDTQGATDEQRSIEPELPCTLDDPCDEVRFPVEVQEAGTYRLVVEFTRGDGLPLAPFVRDQVQFEVTGAAG